MDAAQMGGDLRTAGADVPDDSGPTAGAPQPQPPPPPPPAPPAPPAAASSGGTPSSDAAADLLERAQQFADQIRADAEAETKAMRLQAARALDEARRRNALAESLLGDAQEEAKQLISDAAEQAHLVSEATNTSA